MIIITNFDTKNITLFDVIFRYADAVDLHRELEEGIEKKNIENIFQICKRAFELLKQANSEE